MQVKVLTAIDDHSGILKFVEKQSGVEVKK